MQPLVAHHISYFTEKEERCQEESRLLRKKWTTSERPRSGYCSKRLPGVLLKDGFHRAHSCSAKNLVAQPVGISKTSRLPQDSTFERFRFCIPH